MSLRPSLQALLTGTIGLMTLSTLATVTTLATLTTLTTPASANTPYFPQLTGKVTALPGGNRSEVDGHTYTIVSGSDATERVKSLHIGDLVDLELEGADAAHSSNVVKIDAHPAH